MKWKFLSRLGRGPLVLAVFCAWSPPARSQVEIPPQSGTPPASTSTPDAVDLGALIRRLEQLENDNAQLRREMEQTKALRESYEELERKYDDLAKRLDAEAKPTPDQAAIDEASGASGPENGDDDGPPSSGGGTRLEEPEPVGPERPKRVNLKSFYDFERDGFNFQTEDDEFRLRIRGEVQADARIYQQGGQDPTHSAFYLPRTRIYFDGHMTKPLEYQISFQRGYSGLDVLNAYLNFRFDDRFRIRIGRYKTPYTYEFYKINNWRLLLPERPLFNVNFALNRELGLMGWGEIFENRLEYAVGIFDGPRNSFQDFNDAKDVIAFLNFRPFEKTEGFLKNFNVGGSVDFGNQRNPLRPAVLRTSVNASTADIAGSSASNNAAVPFLAFNNGVIEQGDRALWELHLAYFWNGLTLMGAWNGGFNDYGRIGSKQTVHLPVGGFDVQVGYILTGESISERALVDPIHPFDLRPGKFGLGAFEPFARWSTLTLGPQVFTAGLADPRLWTNRAEQVDVGLNWYLSKSVRIDFDWEHAMFGNPVYFAPGPRLQKTSDLFWFRFQFYF